MIIAHWGKILDGNRTRLTICSILLFYLVGIIVTLQIRSYHSLARIFHESLAAPMDMGVLPGVLGCRPLRRTAKVRLGANTLRSAAGGFMKYPG